MEAQLGAGAEPRWLVEEASGLRFVDWESSAPDAGAARLSAMLHRRLAGEPLQYVLGRWGFRGLDLLVDRRVLIPRPETEIVAEAALTEARRLGPGQKTIVDLGTGSGALALAMAAELADAEVWATDVSEDALAVAEANLAAIGPAAGRVRFARGAWYEALPRVLQGRVDVVVSNPPYVAEDEYAALPSEVRDHEPRGALVAGPTGTEDLLTLIGGAPRWLAPGGALVLELAPHQAVSMHSVARAVPDYEGVRIEADLTGRDRVLVARTACR